MAAGVDRRTADPVRNPPPGKELPEKPAPSAPAPVKAGNSGMGQDAGAKGSAARSQQAQEGNREIEALKRLAQKAVARRIIDLAYLDYLRREEPKEYPGRLEEMSARLAALPYPELAQIISELEVDSLSPEGEEGRMRGYSSGVAKALFEKVREKIQTQGSKAGISEQAVLVSLGFDMHNSPVGVLLAPIQGYCKDCPAVSLILMSKDAKHIAGVCGKDLIGGNYIGTLAGMIAGEELLIYAYASPACPTALLTDFVGKVRELLAGEDYTRQEGAFASVNVRDGLKGAFIGINKISSPGRNPRQNRRHFI
jgi:hypothetical protein